jgi:hypothetical protein
MMRGSADGSGTNHGWSAYCFGFGWQAVVALLAIGCATFVLPYLIPVSPSVSLSYIAGFNNHAAAGFFFMGCLLFAFFVRAEPLDEQEDQPLPRKALFWALIVVFVLCVFRVAITVSKTMIGEAPYFLDRLDHLSRGLIPYRQFEFAYGPLLLYPEVWVARLLHVGYATGYSIVWVASWLIGIWMVWELVRSVDIASRRRTHIFTLICVLIAPAIASRGLNYTALRIFCAAFVVLMVHRVCWRWRRPLWTAGAAVLGVLLALYYSPEQGVGAAAGLTIYLAYLATRKCNAFSWGALAMMLAGFAVGFALANGMSMFRTMHSISSGGYNFPLLPSPSVCLVLGCYLCAACFLAQRLRQGECSSVTLPLVCAGAAMLPAAMGRCDVGHLQSAWPAMLVGVFVIFGRGSIARWWVPLAWYLLAVPAVLFNSVPVIVAAKDAVQQVLVGSGIDPTPVQRYVRANFYGTPGMQQSLLRIGDAVRQRDRLYQAVPCDRVYLVPADGVPPGPCLDEGYYMGNVDVFLPVQIQEKIEELAAHPGSPLLLDGDATVEADFSRQDRMALLYLLESSFFVPRQRNAALSLAPVAAYVSQHYTRVGTLQNGMSVWKPNPSTVAATQTPSATTGSRR